MTALRFQASPRLPQSFALGLVAGERSLLRSRSWPRAFMNHFLFDLLRAGRQRKRKLTHPTQGSFGPCVFSRTENIQHAFAFFATHHLLSPCIVIRPQEHHRMTKSFTRLQPFSSILVAPMSRAVFVSVALDCNPQILSLSFVCIVRWFSCF